MKIRKAIKMAMLGAVIAGPVGMAVAATSPLGSFSYTVNTDGTIAVDCPSGFTCASSTNTDVGFMQRQVTDGTSTFIQTITAEDDFAGNNFSDESYVVMGGTGGISDLQSIGETVGTEVFTGTAELNTGGEFLVEESLANVLAGSIGNTKIKLDQSVSDTAAEFDATFAMREGVTTSGTDTDAFVTIRLDSNANDTAAGFTSGFKMEDLAFEGALSTVLAADEYHKFDAFADLVTTGITQTFLLEERSGAAVAAGGTVTMPNGSTAGWTAGDFIARLQIGQDVAGAGSFGLTDFADETTGAAADNDSFLDSTVPFGSWSPSDPFQTF